MMIRGFVVCVKEREKECSFSLRRCLIFRISLFLSDSFFLIVYLYTYVCIFNMNS